MASIKILWASPNTLLDTSNGAAMMVKECLRQLALRGCAVRILGGTVFVNPEGMSGRHSLWLSLSRHRAKFVNLQEGVLKHRLLVTEQPQRRLMYSYEEKKWFDEYCRLLEADKPDIVLFFDNSLLTLLTADEAKRRNIKVGVFLMHGNNQGKHWCRDVDWMFTDTKATAEMYRQREGYQMQPLGTFVDPDKIRVSSNTAENLLFVNPIPAKGAVLVIQLALWLANFRPDIRLEIVDSRKTWEKLLQEVVSSLRGSSNILGNVKLTPNTLDMRSVYERARVLLVPSLWWESGPRVIVEALINGIPVIGSDSGGIPEVMAGGGEILEIPSEHTLPPYTKVFEDTFISSLGMRICKYFDDEAFYEQARIRAIQAYAQHHDLEKNSDAMMATILRYVDAESPGVGQ